MPIYEYRCRECGRTFEYLLLASSRVAECPDCRSADLEQLISLCGMSSESSRQANLGAAHRKAAGVRGEKHREEHQQHHQHFDS